MSSLSKDIRIRFTPQLAELTCDISHIYSQLGVIKQVYTLEDEPFPYVGNEKIYKSTFSVFSRASNKPENFSRILSREIKDQIWEELFNLKNLFLSQKQADVIMHEVKHPFSAERRCTIYRTGLDLTNYDISHDNTTIWLERKGI